MEGGGRERERETGEKDRHGEERRTENSLCLYDSSPMGKVSLFISYSDLNDKWTRT
jgi:hypothetical protein